MAIAYVNSFCESTYLRRNEENYKQREAFLYMDIVSIPTVVNRSWAFHKFRLFVLGTGNVAEVSIAKAGTSKIVAYYTRRSSFLAKEDDS